MAKTSSEKLTSNHLTDTDGRAKVVLSDSSGTVLSSQAVASGGTVPATAVGLTAIVPYFWDTGNAAFRPFTSGAGGTSPFNLPSFIAQVTTDGAATMQVPRTPSVFKSFASTAITAGTGATVWTPAAGKKFRLMGFAISTSVAGVVILSDNIAATVLVRSPALAAAGFFQLGAADMGNGILSAAANNVLKVDGPTGNVAGMVWGTEE